jgi:membrane protein YdbS with pleckstrin-like domain
MHDTFHMLFVLVMAGALLPKLRKERRARIRIHTTSDGIMDHKLVLVAWNQADRMRRQLNKLGHLVKASSKPDSARRAPVMRL